MQRRDFISWPSGRDRALTFTKREP